MKVKVTFEEGDFHGMHDILFDLTGHSFTHDELEKLWHGLPDHIKDDFIHWGGSDTVVLDNIYEHYEKLMKDKNLQSWDDIEKQVKK